MKDFLVDILYYLLIVGIIATGLLAGCYLYFEYNGWPQWLAPAINVPAFVVPKAMASISISGVEVTAEITREDTFFTVAGLIFTVLGTYAGIRAINFLFQRNKL